MNQLATMLKSQGFKKYFYNTSWLITDKVLRLISGIFVGAWIARYLGPTAYGMLNYALSFVGLFFVFTNLGLDTIVINELVKRQHPREKVLGISFGLKFIGALITIILSGMIIHFTGTDSSTKLMVFVVSFSLIFQSFNVIDFYFQSEVRSKYIAYTNTTVLALSCILKLILILNDAPLIAFAFTSVFDSFFIALGFIIFYTKFGNSIFSWSFDWKIAKSFLKDSWPLIFSAMFVSIYMRVDQVMINNIAGATEAGLYAAAVRISEAWYFVPTAICTSLFPAIINAKKTDEHIYNMRLQKLYGFLVWVAIFVGLVVTISADYIIPVLFGSEYNGTSNILKIHAWTGVFASMGLVSGKWLVTEKLQYLAAWRTGSGLIINIILNFFFIEQWGALGASIATVISYMIAWFLFDFFNSKTKISFWMKIKSFNPLNLLR